MDADQIFVLIMVICFAIVPMFYGLYYHYKKELSQVDSKNASLQFLEANNAALAEQVQQLKERVKVLERIVTDKNYDLNKQFDELDAA